jgi:hypothetical protein
MAHNKSPGKVRSEVLATLLVNLGVGWILEVECGGAGCPKGRTHRIDRRSAHYPEGTVGSAVHRLRCVVCGGGAKVAVLVAGRQRFPLFGPEVRY